MTLGITVQVYVVMQASQSTCTPIQTTNIQCTTNVTIAPLEMISSPILPKTQEDEDKRGLRKNGLYEA